jgi:hypothetical protein
MLMNRVMCNSSHTFLTGDWCYVTWIPWIAPESFWIILEWKIWIRGWKWMCSMLSEGILCVVGESSRLAFWAEKPDLDGPTVNVNLQEVCWLRCFRQLSPGFANSKSWYPRRNEDAKTNSLWAIMAWHTSHAGSLLGWAQRILCARCHQWWRLTPCRLFQIKYWALWYVTCAYLLECD